MDRKRSTEFVVSRLTAGSGNFCDLFLLSSLWEVIGQAKQIEKLETSTNAHFFKQSAVCVSFAALVPP